MAWKNKTVEGIDGVDFINIYSKGTTNLGTWLSHFTPAPIEHPTFGYFRSLEAAHYWLSTGKKHNNLRHLFGYMAKSAGQNLERIENPNFDAEFKALVQLKLDTYPEEKALFIESILPFQHYYEYGTGANPGRIIPPSAESVITLYTQLRFENR